MKINIHARTWHCEQIKDSYDIGISIVIDQ